MNDPEAYIAAHLDGVLTEAERVELNAWLKANPANLRRFTEAVMFEQEIRAAAHAKAEQNAAEDFATTIIPMPAKRPGWLQWRPLAAAAAGIVLGILCTSVVFAYVAPLAGKMVKVLQESFESGPPPLVTGVPVTPGRWSGDYTEVVGEQQGVKPAQGQKMLRFLRADYEGKPSAGGYVADLHQLIDLRPYQREFGDGGAVVQFSAGFNAFEFPTNESYGCLMSLHALDAAMLTNGPMNDRQILNADSLAMASSSRLLLDRNPATWQRLTTELRLPPNTEFLLLRVGVNHVTKTQRRPSFDGHYLDDVLVVVTRRAPLP